jgi:hypothetical protein
MQFWSELWSLIVFLPLFAVLDFKKIYAAPAPRRIWFLQLLWQYRLLGIGS